MSTLNKILISFFLILTVSNSLFAQSLNQEADILSPQNRLRFGNYLFSDKDYLRAIYEYKEFLKSGNDDTVRFKIAYALGKIGRLPEAADNFKGMFFNSSLSEEARLEFYHINFLQNNYYAFRKLSESENYLPEFNRDEVNRLVNVSYLFEENELPDSASFIKPFDDADRIEVLKFYTRKKMMPNKSPVTAALLSAVIPGLGKIYTGQYTDGITALLVTGILGYLTYDNFEAGHNFRGSLYAGLTTLFYAGNIYGSAASAQIFNAGIKFNFDSDLKIFLNEKNNFMPKYEFLK